MFPVNFRPVLIEGYLEASYPSSTTLLVLCVMPTAMMQFSFRIKNPIIKCGAQGSVGTFTIFMVLGRLISGVHWFSDIIGGIFLSAGLILMYYAFITSKTDL
jgi:undecaprenyl-diphosphatase